jgi:hypothetical protein
MKRNLAAGRVDYTGAELRSGFIRERFGVEGDCIVAFRGACRVSGDRLVDLEDLAAGKTVWGDDMLHFIVEIFGMGLAHITCVQRLLCAAAKDAVDAGCGRLAVERRGDDLFVGEGKLSVSVATVSPVSGLVHLGLNVTTEGVPVRAACLADLGLDPDAMAGEIMERFTAELDSVDHATRKVRPVE